MYPLEEIDALASEEEKRRALEATVAQMAAEGIPQEEAMAKAMQILEASQSMPQWPTEEPTNYGTRPASSSFMRDRGTSPSRRPGSFRNIPNDYLTNVNPGFLPDGRVSNK